MLHYYRRGRGPTLILQHGFLGGGRYWAPQVDALCAAFDVIVPDLPGFAGSAAEPARSSIRGHAEALIELLDRLGIGQFHLLGHSMGGMVAQQLALDWPHRVDRLLLYGTASSGRLGDRFESFEESIDRIDRLGVEACAAYVGATWLVGGAASPHYSLCLESACGTQKHAAVSALDAISHWSVSDRLNELHTPTLVICGDRDRSVAPRHAFELQRAIREAELCILPGCAHCAHLDAPDLFNGVVRRFLNAERG